MFWRRKEPEVWGKAGNFFDGPCVFNVELSYPPLSYCCWASLAWTRLQSNRTAEEPEWFDAATRWSSSLPSSPILCVLTPALQPSSAVFLELGLVSGCFTKPIQLVNLFEKYPLWFCTVSFCSFWDLQKKEEKWEWVDAERACGLSILFIPPPQYPSLCSDIGAQAQRLAWSLWGAMGNGTHALSLVLLCVELPWVLSWPPVG